VIEQRESHLFWRHMERLLSNNHAAVSDGMERLALMVVCVP
jgi:hypothetical protein